MSELVDALERLMAEHRRVGSPFPDYLLPGLDPATIRAQIATIGLEAPDEAVELFAWHNGVDHDRYISDGAGIGYGRLFDDVFFGTLDEAIAYYGNCLEIDRGNGRVLIQHLRADAMDQLLNAAGFERLEDTANQDAYAGDDASFVEGSGRVGIAPLEVQPHMQRAIHQVRQRGVLVAHKTLEPAATQTKQFETA